MTLIEALSKTREDRIFKRLVLFIQATPPLGQFYKQAPYAVKATRRGPRSPIRLSFYETDAHNQKRMVASVSAMSLFDICDLSWRRVDITENHLAHLESWIKNRLSLEIPPTYAKQARLLASLRAPEDSTCTI